MRRTFSPDPAVQELQDSARATAGTWLGRGWRAIEGSCSGRTGCLLLQRFTGGRWQTAQALTVDGELLAPQPVVPLVAYTLATRPAADASSRGLQIILSDPAYMGGADVVQTCLRTSAGAYAWADGALAP